MQALLGHHVHPSPQKRLHFLAEVDEGEAALPGDVLHQEVDIAFGAVLTRAKEPKIRMLRIPWRSPSMRTSAATLSGKTDRSASELSMSVPSAILLRGSAAGRVTAA